MKNYIGIRCPRCGGQLDMLVEVERVELGQKRGPSMVLSEVPTAFATWKVSAIPHDCEKPNENDHSYTVGQ